MSCKLPWEPLHNQHDNKCCTCSTTWFLFTYLDMVIEFHVIVHNLFLFILIADIVLCGRCSPLWPSNLRFLTTYVSQ